MLHDLGENEDAIRNVSNYVCNYTCIIVCICLYFYLLFQNIEPYAGQQIELFSSDSEDDEVSIVSCTESKL